MSQPTLFGAFASPFVRKACLVLAFKGIDYKHEQLPPRNDNPVFKAISPLGKIPAWQDEHVGISDSSVITQYLDKFYPGTKLIPDTAAEFAQTLWFEEYADSKMVAVIGAHLFAEVVLAERLFKREPIQADIDLALNKEIPEICQYMETQIAGKEYLVGKSLTLADLAVCGVFVALYHCGQVIDASRFPELAAYVQRIFALDLFSQLIQQEVQGFKFLKYDSPLAQH